MPPSRCSVLSRARLRQVGVFLLVGLVSTIGYALLYLLLRDMVGAQVANVVGLVASTLADTEANRRLTFGVREARTAVRHQALGLGVLVVGLGITSAALELLAVLAPSAGPVAELMALAAANGLVGVIRFVVFDRSMVPAPGPTITAAA